MSSIRFSIPDDQELLAAIAKVAIWHGRLDYMLKMTVRTFDELKIEEALKTTQRMGSKQLRKELKKRARTKLDANSLERFEALLERAKALTERRNELLHGLWAVQDEDGASIIGDRLEGWKPQPTAENLDALSSDLHALIREITEARNQGGFLALAIAAFST